MVVRRVDASESVDTTIPGDGEVDADENTGAADDTAENTQEPAKLSSENVTRVKKTDEKIDFLTAKFYVPEDLRIRAEMRFNAKGSNWRSAILISVITVVVAGALCVLVPDLVQLADNIMSWLAP
jgi:hypothetical protein